MTSLTAAAGTKEGLEGQLTSAGLSKAEAEALVKVEEERAKAAEALKATKAELEFAESLARAPYLPTGIKYQNFSRYLPATAPGALTSGTLKLSGIWLPKGLTVASVSFCVGATALTTSGTQPHAWGALFDNSASPALLRQSTDDTAATAPKEALKTFILSSNFETTYAGLHYVGIGINCGSTGAMPTVVAVTDTVSYLTAIAPILTGNSTTGITGIAPNPALALSAASSGKMWVGVA